MRQTVYYLIILMLVLNNGAVHTHGFAHDTLIRLGKSQGWSVLKNIVERVEYKKPQQVASYNTTKKQWLKQEVTAAGVSSSNCYCIIALDEHPSHDIYCTPSQLFYRSIDRQWIPAYQLQAGDVLLAEHNQSIEILYVTFVEEPLDVMTLQIKDTHTFLVGHYGVVAHNIILPAASLGISIPFSTGCGTGLLGTTFGPIGIVGGIMLGGIIGCVVNKWIKGTVVDYPFSFDLKIISSHGKDNKKYEEDAQAPGMPTENDGFIPPKRWDGEKVRHQKTGQFGWPDKKGKIWVPTGPQGHGGPHWDVQHPNGKDYDNVYPGGIIRPGR